MEFNAYDVALVPLIIGLVAVIVPKKFKKQAAPVVSLALGIAAGILYLAPGDIKQGILVGIALGLTATGLYSGTKNIIGK
jgi:hypothetical protein